MYDVSEIECGTCGEQLEPGDDIYEVWSGSVRDDGTYEGQQVDYHHTACAGVKDRRAPVVEYFEYQNADGDTRTHIAAVSYDEDGRYHPSSLCRAVRGLEGLDVQRERIPLRKLSERLENLCGHCKASHLKEARR